MLTIKHPIDASVFLNPKMNALVGIKRSRIKDLKVCMAGLPGYTFSVCFVWGGVSAQSLNLDGVGRPGAWVFGPSLIGTDTGTDRLRL